MEVPELAKCIQELQKHWLVKFDAEFIVMDPGYNKENRELIEQNAKLMNIPVQIFNSDIFDDVVFNTILSYIQNLVNTIFVFL